MGLEQEQKRVMRRDIIHGLRMRGWERIDAENEADDRIERMRAKYAERNPAHDHP